MSSKRAKSQKNLPMVSMKALSASLRRKSYVEYTLIPKAIEELGVRGVVLALAAACLRDAKKAEGRRHNRVARLLRETAAIYQIAARRLLRPTREGWRLALSGSREMKRPRASRAATTSRTRRHSATGRK